MNSWARKTARLAQRENYLDQLQEIYPSEPKERSVPRVALEAVHLPAAGCVAGPG